MNVLAQNNIGYNLNNTVNTIRIAETSGFGQSANVYRESQSYLYADHASPMTIGSSQPSNSNPYANIYHPKLHNIYGFFEGRRMNMYHNDLEDWRKKERARLKREGIYDRAAIEQIYAP
jgi:hypothetical protein